MSSTGSMFSKSTLNSFALPEVLEISSQSFSQLRCISNRSSRLTLVSVLRLCKASFTVMLSIRPSFFISSKIVTVRWPPDRRSTGLAKAKPSLAYFSTFLSPNGGNCGLSLSSSSSTPLLLSAFIAALTLLKTMPLSAIFCSVPSSAGLSE